MENNTETCSDKCSSAEIEKIIDWVETQADRTYLSIREGILRLRGRMDALLNMVLVGAGGALAYGVSLWPSALGVAMITAAVWLFLVAAGILVLGLSPWVASNPGNETKNLLPGLFGIERTRSERKLYSLRASELMALQQRIEDARTDIQRASSRLKRARLAVVTTPAWFFLAWITALRY